MKLKSYRQARSGDHHVRLIATPMRTVGQEGKAIVFHVWTKESPTVETLGQMIQQFKIDGNLDGSWTVKARDLNEVKF